MYQNPGIKAIFCRYLFITMENILYQSLMLSELIFENSSNDMQTKNCLQKHKLSQFPQDQSSQQQTMDSEVNQQTCECLPEIEKLYGLTIPLYEKIISFKMEHTASNLLFYKYYGQTKRKQLFFIQNEIQNFKQAYTQKEKYIYCCPKIDFAHTQNLLKLKQRKLQIFEDQKKCWSIFLEFPSKSSQIHVAEQDKKIQLQLFILSLDSNFIRDYFPSPYSKNLQQLLEKEGMIERQMKEKETKYESMFELTENSQLKQKFQNLEVTSKNKLEKIKQIINKIISQSQSQRK